MKNERWIGTCISTPDPDSRLDKLHELLLQRLWSVAGDERMAASGRQYQPFRTQYQSPPAVSGPVEVRTPRKSRPSGTSTHVVTRGVVHVRPLGTAHVLAAASTHKSRAATAVESPSPGTREVAPAAQARAGASSDWLLRSLVALVGIAMLALVLAAGSVLPGPGTVRTRLASKGLSSSRIDLGRERAAAPARGRGISYRD